MTRNISIQTEKIVKILEQSGERAIYGVFIGTIAFLVGLSLVLFGLRMSLKLPPLLSKYYLILMLALILPVAFIILHYLIASIFDLQIGYVQIVNDPFIIIGILLLIPVVALLSLIYFHTTSSHKK